LSRRPIWPAAVRALRFKLFAGNWGRRIGEGDFAQTDTREFYDRLNVENKRFAMYKDADGGGGHCEGMGPSRYFADVFGWLDDALAP
jgi:hypothetical protein